MEVVSLRPRERPSIGEATWGPVRDTEALVSKSKETGQSDICV